LKTFRRCAFYKVVRCEAFKSEFAGMTVFDDQSI